MDIEKKMRLLCVLLFLFAVTTENVLGHHGDHSHGDHMHSDHHQGNSSAYVGDHRHGDHDHSDHHNGDVNNFNCSDHHHGNTNCSDHHHHDHHHHDEVEETWACPPGWFNYTGGPNVTCIYLSDEKADFYDQVEKCQQTNDAATPVKISTKEKSDFIIDLVAGKGRNYWLFLYKLRGYGNYFEWLQDDTSTEDLYVPSGLESQIYNYGSRYAYITSNGWDSREYSGTLNYVICERDAMCKPGWFGGDCSTQCHCAGEPCDVTSGDTSCKWGCESGWTGPFCSVVKKEPEVRYYCINSAEEHIGAYVDVHIHTKGTFYRDIHALKENSSDAAAWCNGTSLTPADSNYQLVDIHIVLSAASIEEMRHGNCAGKEVSPNVFQWTLVIQEYEGILLDTDQQVDISCDLNQAETMQRSADFSQPSSETSPSKKTATPETTDVRLDVVDPFTKQALSEVHVGSPAMLQISFGFLEGSMISGVRPYNCLASTPGGSEVKLLLDHNGCPNTKSPLSEFQYDDSNSTNPHVHTKWFPIFALESSESVEFRCSFDLCFHSKDNCFPGCRDHDDNHHDHHHHRRRRDTSETGSGNDEKQVPWSSSVVHVVPDYPEDLSQAFQGPNIPKDLSQVLQGPNFPKDLSQLFQGPNFPEDLSQVFQGPNFPEDLSQLFQKSGLGDLDQLGGPDDVQIRNIFDLIGGGGEQHRQQEDKLKQQLLQQFLQQQQQQQEQRKRKEQQQQQEQEQNQEQRKRKQQQQQEQKQEQQRLKQQQQQEQEQEQQKRKERQQQQHKVRQHQKDKQQQQQKPEQYQQKHNRPEQDLQDSDHTAYFFLGWRWFNPFTFGLFAFLLVLLLAVTLTFHYALSRSHEALRGKLDELTLQQEQPATFGNNLGSETWLLEKKGVHTV